MLGQLVTLTPFDGFRRTKARCWRHREERTPRRDTVFVADVEILMSYVDHLPDMGVPGWLTRQARH
jgi:hypothetical protein